MLEGASHPDRNNQFEFINAEATRCIAAGDPVIMKLSTYWACVLLGGNFDVTTFNITF